MNSSAHLNSDNSDSDIESDDYLEILNSSDQIDRNLTDCIELAVAHSNLDILRWLVENGKFKPAPGCPL